MEKLKISRKYGNPNEQAHDILQKTNKLYDKDVWDTAVNTGELNNYIYLLENSNKINNIDSFKQEYKYNFATPEERLMAISNEVHKDTTISKRQRYVMNEFGQPMKDKVTGEYLTEDYEISNYDYFKNAITQSAAIREQEYYKQIEQEQKDNSNGFLKFVNTVLSIPLNFASEVVNGFVDVANFAAGVIASWGASSQGIGTFSDNLAKYFAITSEEELPGDKFNDWVTKFESKYTYVRDVNGNYTNVGKYLGSAVDSLGQMVGSSFVPGKLGAVLNPIFFYSGMTGNQIAEDYKYLAQYENTISTEQLLNNAALKSALQAGEEYIIGKILGTSTLDKKLFKRNGKTSLINDSLRKRAWTTLFKEIGQEGLEEVIQDTSNFLVDKAFVKLVNEDFGLLTNPDGTSAISFQSLMDAFIIGSIASGVGSGISILSTKRVGTKPKVDIDGNIVYDKKGNIVYEQKLSKIQSWQYGLDMQSFVENVAKINNMSKSKYSQKSKEYTDAFKHMYASYRILTSIYGQIGQERFEQANRILTSITSYINQGVFNTNYLVDEANNLYKELSLLPSEYQADIVIKKLQEKELAEVENVINRGDDISTLDIEEDTKNKLDNLFKKASNIKKVVTTKHGKDIAKFKNELVIPSNYFDHNSAENIITNMCEQDLVKFVIDKNIKNLELITILNTYKEITGDNDADLETAIYHTLFDQDFFYKLLFTSNKDMYNLLVQLKSIMENKEFSKNYTDDDVVEYRNEVDKIIKSMTNSFLQFCLASPYADIYVDLFTDEQRRMLELNRHSYALDLKIIDGKKLTPSEERVINIRVNSSPLSEIEKTNIRNNLQSSDQSKRINALTKLVNTYKGNWYSKYDGKTYMQNTNAYNSKFNDFLKYNSLTISSLLTPDEIVQKEIIAQGKKVNDATIMAARINQFQRFTNDYLTFDITNGNIVIKELKNMQIKSYVHTSPNSKFEEGTIVTRTTKNEDIIRAILNEDLDENVKRLTTLKDIINRPEELLKERVLAEIRIVYTEITDDTVFQYLTQIVQGDSGYKETLVVTSDGDIVFANVEKLNNCIKRIVSGNDYGKSIPITEFVKDKYLTSLTKDITVNFVRFDKSDKSSGYYDPQKNEIFININSRLSNEPKNFTTVIMHEYEHALQHSIGMATGFTLNFLKEGLKNKYFNKKEVINIINDVKKHVPSINDYCKNYDLSVEMDFNTVLDAIDLFLYRASAGEFVAGRSLEQNITFYPIVTNNGLMTMPWGTVYSLKNLKVKNGFMMDNLNKYANKMYNDVLNNSTTEYTIDEFIQRPRSIFITETGDIRYVNDGLTHYKIIRNASNNLSSKTALDYFNTLPEISVQNINGELHIAIRVGNTMTSESMNTLSELINTFYEFDLDFQVGAIYESENTPIVYSDVADNASSLLTRYNARKIIKDFTSTTLYRNEFSMEDTSAENTEVELKEERKLKRKITNKTGKGKWISKKAKVDAEGNIIRDNQGNIQYNYKYKEDRRVSQKEGKGTNLEKYGYTKSYKVTQMSNKLKSFIVNATDKIDTKLWDKLTKGTLTESYIMDYLRDADVIDDVTFKLINDSFFKNSDITTFEELQNYVTHSNEYYAIHAVLKALKYDEKLIDATSPDLALKLIKIITNDTKLNKVYVKVRDNYNTLANEELFISNKYLRKLWMQKFDGSVASAGYIALIAREAAIKKWIITGEGSTYVRKSLQESTGDDITLEDAIGKADVSLSQQAYNYIDYGVDRDEKVDQIMAVFTPTYARQLLEEGKGQNFIYAAVKNKREEFLKMPNKKFAEEFEKIVNGKSEEEINKMFNIAVAAEASGLDATKLTDKQLVKLEKLTEEGTDTFRPVSAVVNNINGLIRTIKSHLSPNDRKRFLENNSDIFDNKLKLKSEATANKDIRELVQLEDRVRQLSKDARQGLYRSKKAMEYKKAYENKIKKLEKTISDLKNVKSVTVEVENQVITLSSTREMPTILKDMLRKQFKYQAPSLTQYVTDKDETHMKMSVTEFISNNASYLHNLTQTEVDSIVDYFANTYPLLGSENERQYIATQICLSTFLLKSNRRATYDWSLSDEQVKILESKLASTVSESAAVLPIWRDVMKDLEPEKIIANKFAADTGIEYEGMEDDIDSIIVASKTGDIKRITKARQKMYENALKNYQGRKKTMLNKLVDFQRLMMLTSPGTWVRNVASNYILAGTNTLSEKIGTGISNVLSKLFPNKMRKREGQYKLVGTKITSEVKTFIDNQIINNGILNLIKDGFNKYDFRKSTKQGAELNLTDLIVRNIQSEIFQTTTFKSKTAQNIQQLIFKAMSDDKWINKRALGYFGKILVENNTDLSKGLSNEVLNQLAEAYTLAAQEFMHKHNFLNDVESKLREKSPKAYFVWKQIAPFAASSWNWFAEGLNYTPIGLAKAIYNYAKLENTIAKLDEKRMKGEMVYSSKFAQYTISKNIGKGIIGSIGLVIGGALAAAGLAGIDEEDDKFKLNLFNGSVKVDISDMFGTQGILMGIAMMNGIIDEDMNFMDVMKSTLDTMFDDSLYTTFYDVFRYSDGFSDFALYLPQNMLQMMVPAFVKTLSSTVNKYKVKYSKGILGKIEKLAVQAVPFLAYAMPHYVDPYTGEKQVTYKAWFITNLVNKLSPVDVYPYNVSDIEKEAISLGVKKSQLTGNYKVNGEDVKLTTKEIETVNKYYGKLNKERLDELVNNKTKYKVEDENGKLVELTYSKMTDKQKATIINRIMDNNSSISKIYILTSTGKYKYYASDEEYKELKKLGLTNIYKETKKLKGFV